MLPTNGGLMESMSSLLAPKAIAVVGASQRRGRGTNVIANLDRAGFAGDIFAVNPRYDEVLGHKCVPSVSALPAHVDCIVVAIAADGACEVLEEAFAHGIRAAIVLAAGFGEGGHAAGKARAERLAALAVRGMCICGPNCMGVINFATKAAPFSSQMPDVLRPGNVALVSQSGGLGLTALYPLMNDRELGFAYFVSCGNQIGATIEDFIEPLVHDPAVSVIAIVVESLKQPHKLAALAREALQQKKSLVLFQSGRSAAGQVMIQSHTGALASNAEIFAAYLRRCGIVQVDTFDEFVETVALFAVVPPDDSIGDGVVVISGSGGGAANAADALDRAGVKLADLAPAVKAQIGAVMPEFGSVTNPIDGTGAIYDDQTLLPKLFDALAGEPSHPVIAASVSARPVGSANMRRVAQTIAAAGRRSERTFVAYSYSPLGGPLDQEIVGSLRAAGIPYLLGITHAMAALKHLPARRDFWRRAAAPGAVAMPQPRQANAGALARGDFMATRAALVASGVPVVEACLVRSEDEALAAFRRFGGPVALKAEHPGLLHKSELGCVRLGCGSAAAVAAAYRDVLANARRGGFAYPAALVQPMVAGVAEAYAGIIDDPTFGPAICFGLGGIFVEIFKDTTTELAPLTHDDALRMIHRIKAAPVLLGARGRPAGDIEALAELLVRLGDYALTMAGTFRALDLNPIIVKPKGEGVVAVDLAVEPATDASAKAAE
jgi:acetate---CoA ligase (ADP-forming)